MLVDAFLEASARRTPDRIALVSGDERLSYAEVHDRAAAFAHALRASGVRRGDRIAIQLDNGAAAVIALFGALMADGVFVLVNPTTKADKLAYILRDCGAAAVVADGRRQAVLDEALAKAPDTRLAFVAGDPPTGAHLSLPGPVAVRRLEKVLEAGPRETAPRRAIDQDLCTLMYTSGSTGRPKGVMLTHLNVVSAARSITSYLGNTAEDVILNVLPLSFDYGLYQVLMAFKVGARVVLERSFAYPHAVLERVAQERVTGLPIVPTMSAILLKLDLARYDLSTLRYVTSTGAALPAAHITQLRQRLPHAQIFSMYGLTECKRVAFLPPAEIDRRPGSVGRAMPNVEVYLVDESGRRLDEGVGELVVRGSNVMQGYWNLPDETARALKPGPLPGQRVLHTGDLFRMDGDGYLYFQGRRDDIIKSRGEKVSPREVENVLYELPGVLEAAVVGEPDPVLGQAIRAVVVAERGVPLGEQGVLRHCASRLEDFMVPQHVEFRDALPKTPSGKIDKRRLDDRQPDDCLTGGRPTPA